MRIIKTLWMATKMTVKDITKFLTIDLSRRVGLIIKEIQEEWEMISMAGNWIMKWVPPIGLFVYFLVNTISDNYSILRILLFIPLSIAYISAYELLKKFVSNIKTVKENRKRVADRL